MIRHMALTLLAALGLLLAGCVTPPANPYPPAQAASAKPT
jgi:starvation-inducible outer membrane lipoprotein